MTDQEKITVKTDFLSRKEHIEEGDLVILYISVHKLYPVRVKTTILNKKEEAIGNTIQTIHGCLNVGSLIGQKYGSRIALGSGWGYILYPTPELWTVSLRHRTQIIYTLDISVVLFQLDLKPGYIVVESGTGSGSLTHALARSVSPEGRVHTFEFHELRASAAKEEFSEHGLSEIVSVCHRDVCKYGFGSEVENGAADAVFLDLPQPWDVIFAAKNCMKINGGRFGSFSPCIEQVQKTCAVLRECGFVDICTMECLQREFHLQKRKLTVLSTNEMGEEEMKQEEACICSPPSMMPGHTGYLTFATLPLVISE